MKFKLVLFLSTITFFACNTSRVITPLNKKEIQVGANLGGTAIKMGELPVFIPLSSVYAAYGCTDKVSAFGSIHTTALLFGVLQTDVGLNYLIKKPKKFIPGISVSPVLNLMVDGWEWKFSFLPQADINLFWQYKNKPHAVYLSSQNWFELRAKRAHNEPQPNIVLPSVALGHQWVKAKYNYQVELKYIGFNQSNQNLVVSYISPSANGALGVYFSMCKKF